MKINVLFFGQLRDLTAIRESVFVVKDDARLVDLIEHLGKEYGAAFRQQVDSIKSLRILINGQEYMLLGGMEALLKEGDTVVLLPPIAGG